MDYYPFGSLARSEGSAGGNYRYGYQGQYAEKDAETDWNSFELRMYDARLGRFLSIDPAGQYWSPYVGMGNDPANQVDPTGGISGPGGPSLVGLTSQWSSAFGTARGALWEMSLRAASNFLPEVAVHGSRIVGDLISAGLKAGMSMMSAGNASGPSVNIESVARMETQRAAAQERIDQARQGYAVDAIQPDYTLESFLLPVTRGTQLLYNGTIRGVLKTSIPGFSRVGGSAAKINYYTSKASKLGYSTSLTGARVKAGIFVQLNHNAGRFLQGRGWKTLYSNAEATIIGRKWQNQAIGSGLLHIGVGTGSLFYNLNRDF